MNKLIMYDYLFHALRPYRIYSPDIDKLGYRKIMINDSAKMLNEILDSGYILSRSDLKNILSSEDYHTLEKQKRANWNGKNNISICEHIGKTTNLYNKIYYSDIFDDLNDVDFAYNDYVAKYPSLILDSRLLKKLSVCLNPYRTMIGEIQIEEKIPIEYIVGVALPNIDLSRNLAKAINYINNPCDDDILGKKIANDLIYMSEEEFIEKYYYYVISFENVLKDTNSNLRLYHTISGCPVMKSTDSIKFIKELKNKYI